MTYFGTKELRPRQNDFYLYIYVMRFLLNKIVNVLKFSKSRYRRKELIKKLYLKFTESFSNEQVQAKFWAMENSVALEDFLTQVDNELFFETKMICNDIRTKYSSLSSSFAGSLDLGGGGAIDLLYFLCRRLRPLSVLETGVAAGLSSYAILSALNKNGVGSLDSSDLPYPRIKNPEKYIGILVPDYLKGTHWNLKTNGDTKNLNEFLSDKKDFYQIIHYDSDKRKKSKKLFIETITPYLSPEAVFIMDDIQDNLAFKEYVLKNKLNYRIFQYEGKFLGTIFYSDL
jgi:hypothetical protein